MSRECEKCGEHCLDCLCFSDESEMEADYKEFYQHCSYFWKQERYRNLNIPYIKEKPDNV
jgi:hypothetical protein